MWHATASADNAMRMSSPLPNGEKSGMAKHTHLLALTCNNRLRRLKKSS